MRGDQEVKGIQESVIWKWRVEEAALKLSLLIQGTFHLCWSLFFVCPPCDPYTAPGPATLKVL